MAVPLTAAVATGGLGALEILITEKTEKRFLEGELFMTAANPEMDSLKARLKSMWMTGDFGQIAKIIETSAEEFVARLAPKPGDRWLDVACGSGNVALPAARAGAVVTG